MKKMLKTAAYAALTIGMLSGVANAGLLDEVKQRGKLNCGASTGLPGFSAPDNDGNWQGLDVDVCRAIAAAILGDPNKIDFHALTAQQRFTALQSGTVDVLSRNTTHTLSRDTSVGLDFAPVTFYDGQGFMVRKDLGVTSALELDGATVCVQPGTTTELNLADYFAANGMSFEPVVIEQLDQLNAAYFAGRCDVYSTDSSGLAGIRAGSAPNPDDYIILPEIISKEPLAPAFRHGDNQFGDVVRWTVYALIEAEELGITSQNVDEMKNSDDQRIKRLLGVLPGHGEALGLSEDWAYNAIKSVGNYGEIYERNVGPNTSVGLERGLNALWTDGGLMYAPPAR